MIPTPTIEEARAALDADIAAYGPWEQWIHPCSRCAKPRVFFGEDGAPLRGEEGHQGLGVDPRGGNMAAQTIDGQHHQGKDDAPFQLGDLSDAGEG